MTPGGFEITMVAIAPGRVLAYEEAHWRDALVLVEAGEVVLDSADGGRQRFRRGDVLCFDGLDLVSICNRGGEPALLVAASRRRPAPGADLR